MRQERWPIQESPGVAAPPRALYVRHFAVAIAALAATALLLISRQTWWSVSCTEGMVHVGAVQELSAALAAAQQHRRRVEDLSSESTATATATTI